MNRYLRQLRKNAISLSKASAEDGEEVCHVGRRDHRDVGFHKNFTVVNLDGV